MVGIQLTESSSFRRVSVDKKSGTLFARMGIEIRENWPEYSHDEIFVV
jgi:hypothetical protein